MRINECKLAALAVLLLGTLAVSVPSAFARQAGTGAGATQQSPASGSAATIPQIIQFSGSLPGARTGTTSITFTLYEDEQGGTALWSETQNVEVDSNGHYTALLGSTSPAGLPVNLFTTAQAHWLEVQPLENATAAPPRVLLVSAPYALKARDAETIGGLPPSAFLRADGSNAPGTTSGSATGTTITPSGTSGPSLGTVPNSSATVSGTTGGKHAPSTPTNYNVTVGYQINGSYVVSSPGSTTSPNLALGSLTLAHAGSSAAKNTGAGFSALFNLTSGVSNTGVGWGALNDDTTGNSNTAVGTTALFSNTTAYYNVAVGGAALYYNTTGANNTATGTEASEDNSTGTNNTANGYQALFTNSKASNNTATGSLALTFTTASDNTANGYGALNRDTTGANNTATGFQALVGNTTGGSNTATGYNALQNNTSASENTADGYGALLSNTTGAANTAVGYASLYYNTIGTDNDALGVDSLESNTSGSYNEAVGTLALYKNTSGNNNTAVGQDALANSTTGNGNVGIGFQAGTNVSTGSQNVEIGNAGTSTDSGVIRIGTAGSQTAFFTAGISGVNVSGVDVLVSSSGQLGVASSSRRYKQDIHDMGRASFDLMRLRPVTFRYKQPFDDGTKPLQYGLIAEEVADVYPDLVARSKNGQIETVRYQLLTPMLLNEVQRQQKEMQAQQEELRDERAMVQAQEKQIELQQAQIAQLLSSVQTIQASLHGLRGRVRAHAHVASPKVARVPAPLPNTTLESISAAQSGN